MDDFVFKYGDLLIAVASLVQIQLATFLIGIGVAGFSIWKFFILHQSRLEEIIQQTTLESAKLHMAINERFELEEMSKISQRIAKHIDDKENFEIGAGEMFVHQQI